MILIILCYTVLAFVIISSLKRKYLEEIIIVQPFYQLTVPNNDLKVRIVQLFVIFVESQHTKIKMSIEFFQPVNSEVFPNIFYIKTKYVITELKILV